MGYHAILGPSGAARWTDCTESPRQSAGIRSPSSAASRPGTACHQAGAECLEDGFDPIVYRGRVMGFPREGDEGWLDELPRDALDNIEFTHTISQADVDAIRYYVDYVRDLHARMGGTLIVEQDVPIDHITGETYTVVDPVTGEEIVKPATGRSDAIILAPPLAIVCDAKFGKKKVRAYDVIGYADIDPLTGVENPEVRRINLQLGMYALGTLRKHAAGLDIRYVRAAIVQPLLDSVSEYTTTVEELHQLSTWLSARAEETRSNPKFSPTFENCLFCPAKGVCPARTEVLMSKAVEGFDDVPDDSENFDLFN